MYKKYLFFAVLSLFMFLSAGTTDAQQNLDSANVLFIDNTSDNNTAIGIGTFMNSPRYKEFPQTNTVDPNVYGFWSNNSTASFYGGNSRRASYYGSGNNIGAHAQYYCTVYQPGPYVVYHYMMNSPNATSNCYVKFFRFGEPTAVEDITYNMLDNAVVGGNGGSWKPLGIIDLFPSDSALTVEIGLDSTRSSNTLRLDAVALVRSSQTGPDLEFGNRRFSRLVTNPATGDTIAFDSFYRHRAPLSFSATTFKGPVFTDKKVTLYNLGGEPLIVSGFSTQTSRFSVITPVPFTILRGGKQDITIRFDPLGEEVTTDTMSIFSNDALEAEAKLALIGEGINFNFILNASAGGQEPHWNVPSPGGIYEEVGTFQNSTATPWPYPIPGGNLSSRVTLAANPVAVFYKFTIPDSLTNGSFFLEYSGPAGSSNAAISAQADIVTPLYSNPNPALGDTQRVSGINLRDVTANALWVRFGGTKVITLNGGGQTVVRLTNPGQSGSDFLRADLLRVRLVPIAATISTSFDPLRLLNFGSISIYDTIRLAQQYQRNLVIGSNGETPLRIDTVYLRKGGLLSIVNLPTFPVTLPAIDGELNLIVQFLPDSIKLFTDSLVIRSNDPDDSLMTVVINGQGVGTGITVDEDDLANYVFPPDVQNWLGTPDPLNLDKWYLNPAGGGINGDRMFAYIYFNPPTGPQTIEWYPLFPFKPGSTMSEVDSFDVFVQIPTSSPNSSPRARYQINHVNGITDTVISQLNRTLNGGKIPLGRYHFLRGGQDSHGSGNLFGSVYLINDTALVSAFYQDSIENTARRDSHVVRADALILEQAGNPVGIFEPFYIPLEYSLSQNYPNPFNPVTQIRYTLPQFANVHLKIYDILGREVKTLVSGEQPAGAYRVEWNGTNNFGTNVSSGVYIYRIVAGKFIQTKKMMFLK